MYGTLLEYKWVEPKKKPNTTAAACTCWWCGILKFFLLKLSTILPLYLIVKHCIQSVSLVICKQQEQQKKRKNIQNKTLKKVSTTCSSLWCVVHLA